MSGGVDYETLSQHSDATRDIGVAAQRHGAMMRVGSWHGRDTELPRASDIAQPGGFRRFFFGDAGTRPLMEDVMRVQQTETFEARLASPLLPFYVGNEGIAGHFQLIIMILKSFTGAAVLYLPRSFLNGGLLLGMVTLASVCFLFTVSMKKLIDCAEAVQVKRMTESNMRQQYMEHGLSKLTVPSYGDVGEEAFGKVGRFLVDVSICASQLGFCSTYFVFVSANFSEVLGTLAGCRHVMSQRSICLLLAVLWMPLSLVRRLKHFSTLNLLADLCILLGLMVILWAAVPRLHDVIPWEVPLMKMESYPLCLGTAAFAFEGIGLVLPMYEGTHPKMRKEFKGTMSWTLSGLCVFFIMFASIAYISFGPTTRTVILFNLHMGGLKRLTSQVLFCMALICTYPVMLHPVSKLIEERLLRGATKDAFTLSGEVLRVSLVFLTMTLAILCTSRLESLVALVGGLACAPLALAFPAALHHILVGGERFLDLMLAFIGLLLALVSSSQALLHWNRHQEIPFFSCSGN